MLLVASSWCGFASASASPPHGTGPHRFRRASRASASASSRSPRPWPRSPPPWSRSPQASLRLGPRSPRARPPQQLGATALRLRLGLHSAGFVRAASLAASSASAAAFSAAARAAFARSGLLGLLLGLRRALRPEGDVADAQDRQVLPVPRLTRRRAFGRYLNAMTLSPRAWRRTSALTAAFATSG